jgi:EAL domain-containing protein (putative c-di-GMP-specific phosphodiesterase class I)
MIIIKNTWLDTRPEFTCNTCGNYIMDCINDKWKTALGKLYYAFQPIVNIHSGVTYGFEALLRGWKNAGLFHR